MCDKSIDPEYLDSLFEPVGFPECSKCGEYLNYEDAFTTDFSNGKIFCSKCKEIKLKE